MLYPLPDGRNGDLRRAARAESDEHSVLKEFSSDESCRLFLPFGLLC
jgi:hypothetical protein